MIVTRFDSQNFIQEKTNLIIGSFDAIHNGHLKLIEEAKKDNLPIVITLFEHIEKIPSKINKKMFTQLEIKLEQLSKLKVDYVLLIDFMKIKDFTGEDFIDKIKKFTNCQNIIVGSNFYFGKNRHYSANDLKNIFPQTKIIDLNKVNNKVISTTFLKELVSLGEIDFLNSLLPFPYSIIYEVKNLVNCTKNSNIIEVHSGIYGVFVYKNNIRYCGIIRVFNNETELFVPDWNKTTFEKEDILKVKVEFISLIRYLTNIKENLINKLDWQKTQNKLINYLKNN